MNQYATLIIEKCHIFKNTLTSSYEGQPVENYIKLLKPVPS